MITIVSGLPRCGTSLMMQMLAAGGTAVLTDGERQADTDNPRGYYEWEPIKKLPQQPALIDQADGRAVKCISQLLFALPGGRNYRIVFMERPLAEVLASQAEMIRRRGSVAAPLDDAALARAFENHLKQVELWFTSKPQIRVLRVNYHYVLRDPRAVSETIAEFLQQPLDVDAMTRQIDPALHRQRRA